MTHAVRFNPLTFFKYTQITMRMICKKTFLITDLKESNPQTKKVKMNKKRTKKVSFHGLTCEKCTYHFIQKKEKVPIV